MKFTHQGIIEGDARVGDRKLMCKLRETKTLWITSSGRKFRKLNGLKSPYEKWPYYYLNIDSIKPINNKQ